MKQVSGRDLAKLIQQRGWTLARINGSHHIFTKAGHRERIVIPSALAFLALRRAKVSAELHIYSTGGHGFGLRPNATQAPGDWPGRAELWLKARKLMP